MSQLLRRLASVAAPGLGALLVASCTALGCGKSDASDPACFDGPPTAPLLSDYTSDGSGAPSRELAAGPVTIDLEACDHALWFGWLPFGSAWVLVHPDGDTCELWLGGETENPMYDGNPRQYCRLRRDGCDATLTIGDGGPARLASGGCVDL